MKRIPWLACAVVVAPALHAFDGVQSIAFERDGIGSAGPAVEPAETPLAPAGATRGTLRAATLVTAEGQMPPGGGGLPVAFVASPFTNGLGQVGFTGAVTSGANDHFVWIDAGIVWRNSQSATPLLTGAESTMGIGDAGQFIYSPSVDGGDAVWTHNGLLAVDETPAPGFPTGTITTFHSRPQMRPSGHAYWVSGFNDSGGTTTQGRVLYGASDATPATIQVVLRSDDVVDGLAIDRPNGIGFDYQISDNGLHHIHDLVMETGSATTDGAIYVDGSLVAREGQPTGDGDNWANFDQPTINDSGDYLFAGDTGGPLVSDNFIAFNGTIRLRESEVVAGVTLTSPAAVSALSLNNRGEAVYIWASGGAERLFASCDASDLVATAHLLLTTGDGVDFDGGGSTDATVTDLLAANAIGPGLDLGDDGRVFVEVDLDFGAGEVEGVIALDLPAICNDVIFADGFEGN